jgi:GT2 family glycosyltransferase
METLSVLQASLVGSMLALAGVLTVYGAYHVLCGLGGWSLLRRAPTPRSPLAERAETAPLVTFLVSAYRERDVVFACLDSILAQRYPASRCRAVLVADEDDEGTLEAIRTRLEGPDLHATRNAEGDEVLQTARLTVILQRGARAGRGKPRALQNAMRYVPREGFVGILDADHVVDPDFVARCLTRFEDARVGIVQAKRRPKAKPGSALARWDVLEQNVGQVQSLVARDRIGCATFYGSTALIRADVLHEAGWQNCLAEDTLLNYEVRERGLRVVYETSTGSEEDHVTSLRSFILQRRRWSAGHMQVLFAKLDALERAGASRIGRWESFLALNYYNATLVVLAYWLVRATHYWMQQPPTLLRFVTAFSLAAGVVAWRFERDARGRWPARLRGAIVATGLAYGGASILLSYVHPAPSPAPIPVALELALFFAPIGQMALGYVNPNVRPALFKGVDHARNVVTLLVLAPLMLVANAYATLTGLLVSVEGTHAAWVKTSRKSPRKESPWKPAS